MAKLVAGQFAIDMTDEDPGNFVPGSEQIKSATDDLVVISVDGENPSSGQPAKFFLTLTGSRLLSPKGRVN